MSIHLTDQEIQEVRGAVRDEQLHEQLLPCPICGKTDHIGLQHVKLERGGKWELRKNFYCGRCGLYAQPSEIFVTPYWNRMVERLITWSAKVADEAIKERAK